GVSGQNKEFGKLYINFVRANLEQLRQKIADELWVLNLLEVWYTQQLELIYNWLMDRIDHALSTVQITSLSFIVNVYAKLKLYLYLQYYYTTKQNYSKYLNSHFHKQKLYSDFGMLGIDMDKINSKAYAII